ncbi:MAG: DNA primase [bacterium]|nr:DNA primase [bacterium]
MATPLETIKEKLDVVSLLKEYLTLTPAGKNFKGRCPFHNEKTPSFMVSPDRQTWHCFGCGLGGDIISFVMRFENIEFGEALKVLADKAGVELRRANPMEYKFAGLLYELQEKARDFFIRSLANSAQAKKYLGGRGLKNETVQVFELGWAPPERDALTTTLTRAGYAPDDLVRAGLTIKTERGMLFDRFQGRIMFPIRNNVGKIVGFTGRILPEFDHGDTAKYMNSPETPIFNKSKVLYGFSVTKNDIREAGSAFLVEGQMDMLMSWQAGAKTAIATSGTALTSEHLKAIRRLADTLLVSFDSDEAGLVAGERAIDLAEQNDFAVKVVQFHGFKDPAEAAQADAEKFKVALTHAIPAPEFYFNHYLKGDIDPRNREHLKAVRIVLEKLVKISSQAERGRWIHELSVRTKIKEATLIEEAERLVVRAPDAREEGTTDEAEPKPVRSRRELICDRLLGICVAKNDYGILGGHKDYFPEDHQAIFLMLKKGEKKSEVKHLDELMDIVILGGEDVPQAEVEELKKNLAQEFIKERRAELTQKIKEAELSGNEKALTAALKELQGLSIK